MSERVPMSKAVYAATGLCLLALLGSYWMTFPACGGPPPVFSRVGKFAAPPDSPPTTPIAHSEVASPVAQPDNNAVAVAVVDPGTDIEAPVSDCR